MQSWRPMLAIAQRVTSARWFTTTVIVCILLNAILLGVETSHAVMAKAGTVLYAFNWVFKVIFVIEITLRIMACHPRLLRFFRDGWNVFDFLIVALTTIPIGGDFANVGRVLRLLRIVRLVSVAPDLKLIIETMFRSIPSMGHVILLMFMLLYVYGIAGFYMFSEIDPANWGTLGLSMLSMFQTLTGEAWPDLQATLLPEKPWAWLFFSSFIILGVFVVVNLFIAVVINNLEKAKADEQAEADRQRPGGAILERLERLKADIDEIERFVRRQK